MTNIVAVNSQMRQLDRTPKWDGSVEPGTMLNSPVVVESDRGPLFGEAIYFGLRNVDGEFYRTVLVLVPGSGSVIEALPSEVRPSTADDLARMVREAEMKRKLPDVLVQVTNVERPLTNVLKQHAEQICDRARELGLTVDPKSAFTKITGQHKRQAVYVSQRGGRVDLSGFCVEHPWIKPVSLEEAKRQHLGSVKGQILFQEASAAIDDAVGVALKELAS